MVDEKQKQWIVVGLGNPGIAYEMTRHNMGALVVQTLAHKFAVSFKNDTRFSAKTARFVYEGHVYHLLLPTTYMNESGQALRRYLDFYKLSQDGVLVVCDDADLPFGEQRLKPQGSAGGHNGLKSIQLHLGTDRYLRLKVGIGRAKESGSELREHVLEKFSREEVEQLSALLELNCSFVIMLASQSVENVMNRANVRVKKCEKQEKIS